MIIDEGPRLCSLVAVGHRMHTKFLFLVGLFGLVVVYQNYFVSVDAGLGKKDQPKPPKEAEIEQLVKDLGHESFAVREHASKQLAQTPGALAILRLFLNDKVLERRRRVAFLVEECKRQHFKKLLRAIVKQKHEAPLDLLVDLVTEHRERIHVEDWKEIFETIALIQANILKDSKTKPQVPDPNENFPTRPLIRGEILSSWDRKADCKIVGDRVGSKASFVRATVVTTASMEATTYIKSIILANGS